LHAAGRNGAVYQTRINPERLVFIDETWTKTNLAPLRGWAQRGARLLSKVPYGHWNTMTFIAALRYDRIEAPWLLDGPINGERFRTYVEKVLGPTLHPDDLVIMDNLGSHKSRAIRHAIRAASGRLFLLPKYSPDLNPIEQVFAKAAAAKRCRTHPRDRLRSHRQPAPNLHRRGMRQLFQQLRIQANLIPSSC
jgi:putative transposase